MPVFARNTAGKAPTGLDRKPVLDQLLSPIPPSRTASHSSHRSNSLRASVGRTYSEDEYDDALPLQVLMQTLGYTPPPPPPPPIQQSPFAPYTTVQSPGGYSHVSTPFTPYTTHGTPAHYQAITPFSTPYGGQVPPTMMTPFAGMGSLAPSMSPASPWSGTSPINITVTSPFSPYHQQQTGYTPHSTMMSSVSLPHGSGVSNASSIYAGVSNTPAMNGYAYSPFGASTPMLLSQNNNSASSGPHLYASPYAANAQVLYSS